MPDGDSDTPLAAMRRVAQAPRTSDWGERLTDARLQALLTAAYPALRAEAIAEAADEVKALREALDNLAHAAREFNTAAAYTVEKGIEDEFITALERAEVLL